MDGLTRGCGIALLCGGVLMVLINTILTPLMPYEESEAVLRTSSIYLIRLSVAGVDALLLALGSIGVHLAQRRAAGAFGVVAFVLAFVGSTLVVAIEWSNVFVLRPLAQVDPDALERLDESALMLGGFISAAGLFVFGWLLLAVSAWRAGVLARWAAILVLAGLVLTTALTPLGLLGAIAGSAVLGLGLAGLGFSVATLRDPAVS